MFIWAKLSFDSICFEIESNPSSVNNEHLKILF